MSYVNKISKVGKQNKNANFIPSISQPTPLHPPPPPQKNLSELHHGDHLLPACYGQVDSSEVQKSCVFISYYYRNKCLQI